MEKPIESKIEMVPCEYTQEDLKRDIDEWIDGPSFGSEKGEFKKYPFLRQFSTYQNNFWTMVKHVCDYINDDGSVDEEQVLKDYKPITKDHPRWNECVAEREYLIRIEHSREIYKICKDLGYDPKEMGQILSATPLSEEKLEMIKNIWIEMRKIGFNRMDLIG
jgi:hypothetical protein